LELLGNGSTFYFLHDHGFDSVFAVEPCSFVSLPPPVKLDLLAEKEEKEKENKKKNEIENEKEKESKYEEVIDSKVLNTYLLKEDQKCRIITAVVDICGNGMFHLNPLWRGELRGLDNTNDNNCDFPKYTLTSTSYSSYSSLFNPDVFHPYESIDVLQSLTYKQVFFKGMTAMSFYFFFIGIIDYFWLQ
jgi:hypothetical protein